MAYTFAYGSLLNADSRRTTIPSADLGALIPARLVGFTRTWNVAFPNDGSQVDKAYFDSHGNRPPFVLFANISRTTPDVSVNGVLIPVETDELTRLRGRELRYELVDVSAQAGLDDGSTTGELAVSTFVGRDEFTKPDDVALGVVPQGYLETILAGVAFWETRCPGFEADFHESTTPVPEDRIARLRRIDR